MSNTYDRIMPPVKRVFLPRETYQETDGGRPAAPRAPLDLTESDRFPDAERI
jgi:hypothetical protein